MLITSTAMGVSTGISMPFIVVFLVHRRAITLKNGEMKLFFRFLSYKAFHFCTKLSFIKFSKKEHNITIKIGLNRGKKNLKKFSFKKRISKNYPWFLHLNFSKTLIKKPKKELKFMLKLQENSDKWQIYCIRQPKIFPYKSMNLIIFSSLKYFLHLISLEIFCKIDCKKD
ncbi:hypothetical protein BpHYR1_015449 [Brachionus plicatilis]|uniref:Uncharacterized protein n=1 Tax=Brachionus plicatilis TaxID=10195 RepID=A0A3M7SFC5_BRAPC|nr:hypothetical protein BpHYR1_015449 [Brachionus plicatilis]